MLLMPREWAVAAAPGGVDVHPTGAILDGVKRKTLSLLVKAKLVC
jgi:hypothetical protein